MSFEERLSKKHGNLSERRQVKNDLCELQNEERERNMKKQSNRLKGKSDDKQDLCHHELLNQSVSGIELFPYQSNGYNQLLTNTDRSWIISHTQNRRRGRKSLQDYLQKNHEIFTLQYILNIKHNEIERLENHLREQERALTKSEKYIIEDLALFDQFLDTWNRNTSDAVLRADEESQKKEELINEIKRLQKILITYQNDHNHLIDILKQSRRYQQFLFKFAPEEWQDDILKHLESTRTDNKLTVNIKSLNLISNSDITFDTDSYVAIDENYSLYFTKPEQLLEIFTEMEEKSLPLVQKSQHTSETLDKIHSTINLTITEQNLQVEQLQIKIDQLEESIKHEIEREISNQNILIEYKTSKTDPFIDQIKKLIEILYKKYIISDDIGLSTIHMLQTIENKIKSLFNIIENMDSSLIIEAEKSREITVRTLKHQEKLRQEKLINDLKHQKALLRSSAPPYSKVGRKLMERSRPPLFGKKYQIKHSINNKQEQLMRLLDN